jgi:sugar transport system substrate-binding protein
MQTMTTKRSFWLPSLLLTFGLALSACGSPTTTASQPTAAPAATSVPEAKKLRVAGVVFQGDTFMQTIQAGMQDAANQAGVELVLANTQNDLAKETSVIDDYITSKVDALVITPISNDASGTALKKAKDAGITVICYNSCVADESVASSYLVTKNEDLGTTTGDAAVKFITEQMGGKATIGILNCDIVVQCQERKAGFLAKVKALPGVTIVADQEGYLADKAQPVAEAMLQANPEINLFWAANEGGTVGAALAVKSSGLAGKVFVFGTDMNDQMAQMLQSEDNILQGVTGQAPYQMGYDALLAAVDVLNGKSVQANVFTPTIFFGRGDDARIKEFVDSGGKMNLNK